MPPRAMTAAPSWCAAAPATNASTAAPPAAARDSSSYAIGTGNEDGLKQSERRVLGKSQGHNCEARFLYLFKSDLPLTDHCSVSSGIREVRPCRQGRTHNSRVQVRPQV